MTEKNRISRMEKLFASLIENKIIRINIKDYANIVKAIKQRKDKKDFQIVNRYGKLFLKYVGNKEVSFL